jgi:3-methyladenine DNA glycosylase AlkC
MAESLKHLLDGAAAARIADMLQAAWPGFRRRAFLADVLPGFEALDLMPRGRRIADAMRRHLPGSYPKAIAILVASLGPPMALDAAGEPLSDGRPYSAFLYLPHSMFIATHGLDHFEGSMRAQHALTQRFTAEFCVRPFLQHRQDATLERLMLWTEDSNAHVRRLASEGSRPRLPWAARLSAFVADPRPLLPLLERLKDDPSSYVRRSVANHLNDIGKDHPELLLSTARAWLDGAGEQRQRLVRHALRFAVKRGDPQALGALGLGHAVRLDLGQVSIEPARPVIGGSVNIEFELRNPGRATQVVLADLRVLYVKAGGQSRPKVFKLRQLELPSGGALRLSKRLSLAQMTTRQHHAGIHKVDLLLNGRARSLGQFDLRAAPR